MISLYVARDSWLHHLPSGLKLLILLVISSVLFIVPELALICTVFVLTSLGYAVAKLSVKHWWQALRVILWLAILLFALHLYWNNLLMAGAISLRLITLVLLASLVTLTTRLSDMMQTIEWMLSPLTKLGIRTDKLSLSIALCIRFIPVLQQIMHEVKEAQACRGLDRHWLALMTPILVRTLKMADDLAQAIDARGYDADHSPPPHGRL